MAPVSTTISGDCATIPAHGVCTVALNSAAGRAKSITKIFSSDTFLLSTILALPAQKPSSMMRKIGARA